MKILAAVTSAIATFIALTASSGSWLAIFDEAELPESLIK